jgi:hypothetical protein
MGRKKKATVNPELARKWLSRHEEYGESVPQIAKASGYDARTVRKYLALLSEEREQREARQVVLRGALEKHHADLCSLAERLKDGISGRVPTVVSSILRENPLYEALQQHISRWPLWRDIEKLEQLKKPFDSALQAVRKRVRKAAERKSSLKFVPSSGDSTGLLEGWIDSITFHVQSIASGGQGLKGIDYSNKDIGVGILIQLGAYTIALVGQEQAQNVEELHSSRLNEAPNWEESTVLFRCVGDFTKVQGDIKQQLTKVILRRILPGRCIYCPF